MSKKQMSKNTTIKKVRKLERQKKYEKALTLCDDYLDTKLEKEIIQIKTDLLTNIYYTDNFVDKANEYKLKLNKLLNIQEYTEILKIFKILEDLLKTKSNKLTQESDIKIYLSGGLILDSLETILVLNEFIKSNENKNNEKGQEDNYKSIDNELKEFIIDVKKTAYQYLGLHFKNPKEFINSSNINTEDVIESIHKLVYPENKEETENNNEKNNQSNDNEDKTKDENNDETEDNKIDIESLKEEINTLNQKNKFEEALNSQRKLVKIAKRLKLDKSNLNSDSNQKTLFNYK